jgi:hypothetical protein
MLTGSRRVEPPRGVSRAPVCLFQNCSIDVRRCEAPAEGCRWFYTLIHSSGQIFITNGLHLSSLQFHLHRSYHGELVRQNRTRGTATLQSSDSP